MMKHRVTKPQLCKTLGTVLILCLISLFVCVYLLFSGIHAHEQQLQKTEAELQETRIELQQTKYERFILQNKVGVLEGIEYQRGTMKKP